MIKRLKYHEIDFEKYELCLKNSVQKNFYANREILDQLCNHWDLLIYRNYEAVMPVPVNKKWGFSVVLMPLFCQQFGVFSKIDNQDLNAEFLKFLKKEYHILNYAFNFQNLFPSQIPLKKNYVISTTDYIFLRKKYFKGRKSTVKTAQYHEFRKLEFNKVVQNYIQKNFKGLHSYSDADKFFKFLDFLNNKNLLKVFGSLKNNDITSIALLIDQVNKLSLLGLINDEHFRNDNGASFLIDKILKENIHEKNFDFMGGNIRGIEVFFKSFGAELQKFPFIQNTKKDLIWSFFFRKLKFK